MENASQALIISGAILLAVLIIALGMYIYNNTHSSIEGSMANMSTQEIEAYNNKWETYRGPQKGTQVIALLGKLIANAKTYEEYPDKVPNIHFPGLTGPIFYDEEDSSLKQRYVSGLSYVKSELDKNHVYYISFGYDAKTGLLKHINIGYDENYTSFAGDENCYGSDYERAYPPE